MILGALPRDPVPHAAATRVTTAGSSEKSLGQTRGMDVSESSRQSSATQAAQGEYCGKSFESTRAGQVSNQSIISVRPRRASPLSRGLAFAVAALSALALSAC